MKKQLIGSIVGGLLIFIWQFLSFAAIDFHYPAQQHTPKQDEIVAFMSAQGLEEGGYFMPRAPKDASMEEATKAGEAMQGKPWMRIEYHKAYEANMVMNMIRGLLVNIIIIYLFIGLLKRMGPLTTGKVVTTALATGLIIFLNSAYTNHIWYQSADIWAHLMDAVVSWGLAGAWLGWYLRDKGNAVKTHSGQRTMAEVA